VDSERQSTDEDEDEGFNGSPDYSLIFYTFFRYLASTDFIDDEETAANNSRPRLYPSLPTLNMGEDALESLLGRIDERVRSRPMEPHPERFTDTMVAWLPSEADYPLWRVRCRVILFFCNG